MTRKCFACARVGSDDELDAYSDAGTGASPSPSPCFMRYEYELCALSAHNMRGTSPPLPLIVRESATPSPHQLEPPPTPFNMRRNSVPHRTSTLSVGVGWLRHLSGSAPAVSGPPPTPSAISCHSRQRNFLRHFNVDQDETLVDYFSCALVADILVQGHLYISKHYFAFYSNMFGYESKVLIPMASVVAVSKEKTAFVLPNAVAVTTTDRRHVFSSLLNRDVTFRLMVGVWRDSRTPHIPLEVEGKGSMSSQSSECSSLSANDSIPDAEADETCADEPSASTAPAQTDVPSPMPPSLGGPPKLLLTAVTALLAILLVSASVLTYKASLLHQGLSSQPCSLPQSVRSFLKVQEFLDYNLNHLLKVRRSLDALSLVLESEKERIAVTVDASNVDLTPEAPD